MQRLCNKCGQQRADGDFRSKKYPNLCLYCLRDQRKKHRKQAAAKRRAMLDKIERAGIDLYAQASTTGGNNIPHSAEVLERLFQYFGGVSGFTSIMVKQYYDSPPGGSARNKLLETIVRLVSKNVEQGGAKRPLTLWTEEELEAELNARFQQALTTYKGLTVNAKALPAPESAPAADHPIQAADQPDGVPEGGNQDPPVGNPRKKVRGAAPLPTDPTAGEGPPVQGP